MALVLDGDSGIVGVLATNADGDVIIDTNTFFVDAPNNSVGIGTLTPTRKLHVSGSARFDMAAGTVRISEQQSKVSVQATNSAESAFADLKLDGSNIIFNTQSNGNVGIGNDNPLQKLSVTGRMNVDQQSDYYGAWIDGNTAGDSWFAVGTWYTNGGRMTAGSVEGQGLHLYTHNTGHQLTLQKDGGNVVIGNNTTEGYRLEVVGDNAANQLMVHKKNAPGSGFATNIAMQVTQTNGQSARLAEIGADFVSGWGGELHFATKDNNGSPNNSTTERMRINADGQITMPYQPVCSTTHGPSVNLSDVILTSSNFYDTIWVNRGGHFNSSNGRFTCPVGGVYRIYFRATGTGNSNVRLRKNGSTVNEAYEATGTNHSVSSEAVVNCAAGDYLEIQVSRLEAIGGTQHKQVTFEFLG